MSAWATCTTDGKRPEVRFGILPASGWPSMTIERKNWHYDNSGGEIAPATPSPQEVVAAVERGEPPTREQQVALGVEPTAPATALKAADVLRLSTSYGPSGGALKGEQNV
jgi:hypothetical protein